MKHPRFRPTVLALLLSVSCLSACTAGSVGRTHAPAKQLVTRPVATKQLTMLPAQVTLGGGSTAGIAERRVALQRDLESAIADKLAGRATRMPAGVDHGPGVVRIQHAFGTSPVYLYREFTGVPSKPRRRVAEGESRALAAATGADTFVIARFVGTNPSASGRLASSATEIAGAAAMGLVTLSPIRIVTGTASAVMSGGGQVSELRIALVDGPTGEILWANWIVAKEAPTTEVVGDLVDRAFATFPPAANVYPQLTAR